MADSESQQVTSKAPTTKPKNPKWVAAGKAIAEKTRQACEVQKKALAEAQIIIANQNFQKKADRPVSDPPVADPPVADPPVADPPVSETTRNVLTTTQWQSVIGIFVSILGIYYKHEEIKRFLTKKPPRAPPPSPVDTTTQAPQVGPKRKGGIRLMD